MLKQIRPAIVLTLAFTLLTGIAYPLAMTGIGQVAFPAQANGSRIDRGGVVVGSALIGQDFTQPQYFWPRPSGTGPEPYNASASSGSNYGPTDVRLIDRVSEAIAERDAAFAVPADAVTTSASGLDPHISPDNARMQVARIARARGQDASEIESLLNTMTELPLVGIFGEPRVNVLELNLALDRVAPLAR
jgi:K+-transporting ATPase ATPase C chain